MRGVQAGILVSGATAPNNLKVGSQISIRNVAATIAYETMTYYEGNTTSPNSREYGSVQKPYYWWVAGALWGAMLDYYHYTSDPSYNGAVIQALLAPTNVGPGNYQPPEHADEEGNDDLFFWGSAVLSAAERNFPQPNPDLPSWLGLADNVFNELSGRWDTKYCGGGLFWQISPDNPNGMTYKNSVSNGGFFQLSARLARATGNKNQTYLEWANKIWDWTAETGIIDKNTYRIYDGASIDTQCKDVTPKSFSYTAGIFLYGAAVMANITGKDTWIQRTGKLLDQAGQQFFTEDKIMYEPSCEPKKTCNYDMITFKGYLSRFMWQTALIMPSLREKIHSLMIPTAQAASSICTGGKDGRQCGMKWYTGAFDFATLGGQMGALEAVQGLLSPDSAAPLKGEDIKWVKDAEFKPIDPYADVAQTSSTSVAQTSSTSIVSSTTSPSPSPTPTSTSTSEPSNTSETQTSPSPSTTTHHKNAATPISKADNKFASLVVVVLITWRLT